MLEHYFTLHNLPTTEESKEPQLDVLRKQIAPLLDRTGKLMCDMAHCVKPSRGEVMLMPTQREIASLNPRELNGT